MSTPFEDAAGSRLRELEMLAATHLQRWRESDVPANPAGDRDRVLGKDKVVGGLASEVERQAATWRVLAGDLRTGTLDLEAAMDRLSQSVEFARAMSARSRRSGQWRASLLRRVRLATRTSLVRRIRRTPLARASLPVAVAAGLAASTLTGPVAYVLWGVAGVLAVVALRDYR